jgi:hypothetical protein
MIPVYQKELDGENGDCLRAVWASLLHLKLHQVPHFVTRKDWVGCVERFVNKHGYEDWAYFLNPNDPRSKDYPDYVLPEKLTAGDVNGYWQATVYSPRFYPGFHAVIVDSCYNIIHDPNPLYKGIEKYPDADRLGKNGVIGVNLYNKTIIK